MLQHADNPVHWQPWDDTAFAAAKEQDKPILLSIGYAACHWCHVMAHDSFADDATAALMNAHFINIKVDREERPDIDRIYQSAHYLFTRKSGGWPLTMFLTPDGTPFFGGTYFPKTARLGLPAFSDILKRVYEVWHNRRDSINSQNTDVLGFLRGLERYDPSDSALTAAPLTTAAAAFLQYFDNDNGGLGKAPKFPHAVELTFCLRYALEYNDTALLEKTRHTLNKIAASGLTDHLGGGFFRYCVDDGWRIPHFEKMLSDNALLLSLYADAAVAFNDDTMRRTAANTAAWLLGDMRNDDALFYAALDADSPGGEGAFYLWNDDEINTILPAQEQAVFTSHYATAASVHIENKIHLTQRQTLAQTAAATGNSESDCRRYLAAATDKLLQHRRQRPPPATDDKHLTAWNALACRALARSARLLDNPDWLRCAHDNFYAIQRTLRHNGRTRAARRNDLISNSGFLDDCAFLLDAALELLRAQFCPHILADAIALADELVTYYYDNDNSGFYFTAHDGEQLIQRLKSSDDNALPNGNGVAIGALLLLAQLTGDTRWQTVAESSLNLFYRTLSSQPTASASMLTALQFYVSAPSIVYLTGDSDDCRRWQQALKHLPDWQVLVFCLPADTTTLPPPLQKPAPASGVNAYVCDSTHCAPPLTTLDALKQALEK